MISVPVNEFARWIDGEPIGFAPTDHISTFALDSNSVCTGDLFFAIKGEKVDGHDFVQKAINLGAIGSISERDVTGPTIRVGNLISALAKLGAHFRDQFRGPVVGITGSAGKTTTKEFTTSALSSLGPILRTHGNRNTEYTVPLLWTELRPEHRAVVVEMSMRGFDQVRHLALFSRPSIGLVTNIGFAHMLQVGSREGIADAKGELLELLTSSEIAILWHEDEYLERLKSKTKAEVFTFGASSDATCYVEHYQPLNWQSSRVSGRCSGKPWTAVLPAVGRHIALNAAAAILVAHKIGIEPQQAAASMAEAVLPPMRMEVVAKDGVTILLDTYNASPPSMISAIETLNEIPVEGKRLAILGDMKELGDFTEILHRSVGLAVSRSSLDRVLFFGDSMKGAMDEALAQGFAASAVVHVQSLDDVRQFVSQSAPGDVVLIKGSRSLELERVLEDKESC